MNSLLASLDTLSPRSASRYFLANPYATPTAELRTGDDSSEELQLASRGKRLGAVLIDGIIFLFIFYGIVIIFALFMFGSQGFETEGTSVEIDSIFFPTDFNLTSINLLNGFAYLQIIVTLGLYTLINGYLLWKRGQSVGKMLLEISIRDKDTMEVPPLTRIILKRYLIIDAVLLINYPLQVIVDLIDVLSIFKQDKRMIHDLLANTIVVQLPRNRRIATKRPD